MAFHKGHKPWNTGLKGCRIGFAVIPQPEIPSMLGKKNPKARTRQYAVNSNPYYKGGIIKKIRDMKSKVKKTYCEICGFVAKHRCQLDVDHKDGNRNNNKINNLWTLCSNCHRLKTYKENEYSKIFFRDKYKFGGNKIRIISRKKLLKSGN